jgi:hypothetical protein
MAKTTSLIHFWGINSGYLEIVKSWGFHAHYVQDRVISSTTAQRFTTISIMNALWRLICIQLTINGWWWKDSRRKEKESCIRVSQKRSRSCKTCIRGCSGLPRSTSYLFRESNCLMRSKCWERHTTRLRAWASRIKVLSQLVTMHSCRFGGDVFRKVSFQ